MRNLAELSDESPVVTAEIRQRLADAGFVRLTDVFSAETVANFAPIVDEVGRKSSRRSPDVLPCQRAFIQEGNVWQRRADIRPLVFSARLARIAADLLDVAGVRIYHDQALIKEAHGGRTPWHCDQSYWPFDTDKAITAWIPLHAMPSEMGPLQFRRGSHLIDLGRSLEISAEAETAIERHPEWAALSSTDDPYEPGTVSFHLGWTFHGARPNDTSRDRLAVSVIYFPNGACMSEPTSARLRSSCEAWLPGCTVGRPIASWLNPVVWSVDGAHAGVIASLPEPANMVGVHHLP